MLNISDFFINIIRSGFHPKFRDSTDLDMDPVIKIRLKSDPNMNLIKLSGSSIQIRSTDNPILTIIDFSKMLIFNDV